FLFLSLVLVGGSTQVAFSSVESDLSVKAEITSNTTLNLTIEDRSDVANACDYYVESFQYIKPINSLVVQVAQNFCRTERYGKGKAQLQWVLPNSMRGGNARLQVIVNQKRLGTLVLRGSAVEVHDRTKPVQ
ncbi:MAG: hypothetical protein AB1540_17415, partial [Bdellovibrionota bacterium]